MSWDSPSWKKAAQEYHAERLRHGQPTPARRRGMRRVVNGICRVCEYAACTLPSFCEACWRADGVTRPASGPPSVVDAIVQNVKARGADALKEPDSIAKLAVCDDSTKARINTRLAELGVHHG
jgi:hypothetical protein